VGVLACGGLALGLAGAAGWWVTDLLERDNDFCTACHLTPTRRLHQGLRDDFEARPATSLAAAHAAAGPPARPEGGFRCIDCHGGASWVGRARVKALAARDAFWYVVGRFEEPEGMRWPLWDEDCRKCHVRFERAADTADPPDFHALPVHNVDLPVRCVECHLAHDRGGNPEAWFLAADPLRAQCARCHSEFETGGA